ncbi:MAG TPA: ABC transporter ATP-binding protein [Anaerolineales bacterium]|nr:ABC transporter ATP-binding protein [Anaerolineales bacterium]
MSEPAVRTLNLTKDYGDLRALDRLNLDVQRGQILAVLGPSGCGKTTLLRLLAGFERPTSGEILLAERLVASPGSFIPPEQRGVGMVFQEPALFPHFTVFDNIAFGLPRAAKEEKKEAVRSMLTLVGLDNHSGRYPHELSGGERQRVALARALAPRPVLILLDEPFSNLDADRRLTMRDEVRAILKGINATAVFVTHDQEEALFMGDQLALIRAGLLEQVGTPEEIYHQPDTRFVADFMGETEWIPGKVTAGGILTEIGLLLQPAHLPDGSAVDVAVRPDDIDFQPARDGDGLVLARHFRGESHLYRLRLPSGRLVHANKPHTKIIPPGTRIKVVAAPEHPLPYFPKQD